MMNTNKRKPCYVYGGDISTDKLDEGIIKKLRNNPKETLIWLCEEFKKYNDQKRKTRTKDS